VDCYKQFLLGSHDPEEREYPDAADQIREILIHGNYMSQKDIGICLSFDLVTLVVQPQHGNIRELHDALMAIYGSEPIFNIHQ